MPPGYKAPLPLILPNTMTDSNLPPANEPLRFESPPLGLGDQQQLHALQKRNNKVLWAIFSLLLALTGSVIFILPALVKPGGALTTTAPASVPVVTPTPAPAEPARLAAEPAPFAAAQKLKLRQDAQDVLAPLLDLQKSLEKQQVQQWAGDAYTAAIALAKQGDDAYGKQQFEPAVALYQQALHSLQAIDQQSGAVFSSLLAKGKAAIDSGNAAAAEAAFNIAIGLQPDNSEVRQGLERAHVLNQVLSLLKAGKALLADSRFDAAREKFQQAASLDPANLEARTALANVATAQANQKFAALMSRGFAALQADAADTALAAFEQAGAMRPGSAEVAAAVQQAKDKTALNAITAQINAAQAAEAGEDWNAALSGWKKILELDPNLVSAQEGQRRARSRNNLDQFLIDTLANPLRLGDKAVYDQTSKVMHDATALVSPGPKLQKQLLQVQDLMARARVPVEVVIQSDGQTRVSVNGVGELGPLTSKTLSLLPGTYVATGARQGYRDVRQEFVVGLDGKAPQLTVVCKDSL